MDASSSLEASVFDPSKSSELSMEQKRQLVYEISKWSDGATEMLHAWSRQEILQILCAELGKERKYTGLTKSRMIEYLLKIVDEKKSQESETANVPQVVQPSPENGERTQKRQRKSEHPNRLQVAPNAATSAAAAVDSGSSVFCKNSACKAKLNRGDAFCKRCSCCICRQYDDNKDPSLWLVCNSDPPFRVMSCGMSCHLECALGHDNSGISKDKQDKGLDGIFSCVSCGKVNDLLSTWRKQLVVARDTRRVDILCYRLSLSQKILAGTKQYQNLCGIVDKAVKKLEEDVGPLTGLPVKTARGIVNRLSSGPEIQRLCALAVESLDLMLSNRVSDKPSGFELSELIRFEDIRASSVTVLLNSDHANSENIMGYALWHRKADDIGYPIEPTCRLFVPNTKFVISGLNPATEYFLKVVILETDREKGFCEFHFRTGRYHEMQNLKPDSQEIERGQSPATNCSDLSSHSSRDCINGDENRGDNYAPFSSNEDRTDTETLLGDVANCLDQNQKETAGGAISVLDEEHNTGELICVPNGDGAPNTQNKDSANGQMTVETRNDNGSNMPSCTTGLECIPYMGSSGAHVEMTPENMKDSPGRKGKRKLGERGCNIVSVAEEEPQAGSSSKKRSGERRDKECNGIGDKDFEYYVKVIRSLECDGHIEASFRQKFLTWYSLRATPQEMRIVKVFIDTFIEDPASLAGQLLDTFSDVVSNKRCSTVPSGFCMKLWH